jgi:hypothetical protein
MFCKRYAELHLVPRIEPVLVRAALRSPGAVDVLKDSGR